jgi:hypothetical protein
MIYETDTGKAYLWNGSAWKQVAVDGADAALSNVTTSGSLTTNGPKYAPGTPMFAARATAGTAATQTWNTYVDVFTNVGNHFNPTTGLFTAPYAGKYYFTFSTFTEAGQQAQVFFLLNGGAVWRTYTANGTGTYVAVNPGIVIFSLNANDTVGVYVNPGQTHFNANNYFVGMMVG